MTARDYTLARTMRADGHTLATIGRLYGVSSERIRQVTIGVAPPSVKAWHGEAETLARAGYSMRAIAETLGFSEPHVRAVMRRRGVAIPDRRVAAVHGTRSKYTGGCHCDACRAAQSAYMRSRYAKRKGGAS